MTDVKWKSLEFIGCPMYMVSSEGEVKNVKTGKLIKPQITRNGYYQVTLHKNGKRKWFYLHRLVAMAFIPNEGSLPAVNHKNENKHDNTLSNLEWCTYKYNYQYSNLNRSVYKYNTEGELLCTYWSIGEAARCNGISMQALFKYLNGHLVAVAYHGFIYRYEGQNPLEPIRNDEAIKRKREYLRKYKLARKEQIKERRHERYQKNREKILEQQRKYRQANEDRIKERQQKYYLANKEKWRQYRLKKSEQIAQEKPTLN